MSRISKALSIIIITVLAASSIVMVESASGSTKPSTPEFTMKLIDKWYDVPPTYEINQFTGENVTTNYGYRADNKSIEFTIKNQPFTPYNDTNDHYIGLYYNFQTKGAYGNQWANYLFSRRFGGGGWWGEAYPYNPPEEYLHASTSEYTVISINLADLIMGDIPAKGQVEIQVQALIGYLQPTDFMLAGHTYIFTGESSDWSATQTITIGEGAPTETPTPNASPSTSAPASSSTSPSTTPPQNTATPTERPVAIAAKGTALFGLNRVEVGTLVVLAVIVVLLAVSLIRRSGEGGNH
jgi:hypothetical protein